MSVSCQRCSGASTVFLCSRCTADLRTLFRGLAFGMELGNGKRAAGWIEHLQDHAWGKTRMGESARRSTERNTPLPVHLDASELLDQVHMTLVRWVQDICDTRGITYTPPRMVATTFIGPLPEGVTRGHASNATRSAAVWLLHHVSAIACDESAGLCFAEIQTVVELIEKLINRPIPQTRYLGPCPERLTDNYGERICNTELTAGFHDREIQCPSCRATHHVNELLQRQVDDTNDMSFTLSELYKTILPINREYVPLSTLRHWIARNRLVPTGHDADGEPRYLLADVRALRDARPQRGTTGAAAHKRPA